MSAINSKDGLRERQRAARDADILKAAWDLLATKGYEDWTLADLADRAGISRRTLYHHFPSKEAIAAETIAQNNMKMVEEMMAVEPDAAPVDRLEAVVRWILELRVKPRSKPVQTIKSSFGLMTIIRNFPSYKKAKTVFRDQFTNLIARAQEKGPITRKYPADYLADLLIAMLQGLDSSLQGKNHPGYHDDAIAILFNGLKERGER